MKSKIYKRLLLACIAALSFQTGFAQETPQAPPAPAATPMPPLPPVQLNAPDKADLAKMKDLKIKMKALQKKMNSLNQQQIKQMNLKLQKMNTQLKQLDKTIDMQFNDSAFNFTVAPPIAMGFKDFDNNFTFNTTDDSRQNDVSKVKAYSKSYSIDENDVINLDNRFGKIVVNTWNKNEVKVDIQIKATYDDDDKAQKMLDRVSIKSSKDGSGVYFKTVFNNESSSWSLFGGRNNNDGQTEVNYTVYMPARNPLNVSNKYGSTSLPDLDGKLIVNNAYGSLVAKSLSNSNNQITVKYGSANISNLNGSDLDVAYGSLTVGECNKLNADVSYGSAKIGKIVVSGNVNLKFGGGLSINEIDKNIKNLTVNSSYSSVKLGISNGQNADFDVTVRYGNFNYGGHDINITSKTPSDNERGYNPTKNYKGQLGKGSNDKNIVINASYGSVSFD